MLQEKHLRRSKAMRNDLAKVTFFGKTKLVPKIIYHKGEQVDCSEFNKILWVERGEDWYALEGMKNDYVLIVERATFLKAKEVSNDNQRTIIKNP